VLLTLSEIQAQRWHLLSGTGRALLLLLLRLARRWDLQLHLARSWGLHLLVGSWRPMGRKLLLGILLRRELVADGRDDLGVSSYGLRLRRDGLGLCCYGRALDRDRVLQLTQSILADGGRLGLCVSFPTRVEGGDESNLGLELRLR
jgi:hypothetical protein